MKILIVHNFYLQPGGEDEVVKAEKNMLLSHGHKIVSYERTNKELLELNLLRKFSFFTKDIYWSDETYRGICQLIKKERPDVAHIHNTFSRVSSSVYQACKDEGVPVVQTLHNYRYLCPIGVFYRHGHVCEDCLTQGYSSAVKNRCWKNSKALSWVLTRTIKEAKSKYRIHDLIDQFIVLSEFSQKMYLNNGWPKDKMVVKPNFLDTDVGAPLAKGNHALFVGALQPYKGVELLLRACEKLGPDYPVKIIGDGPLRVNVENAEKKGIVSYLGHKSWAQMIEEMKSAQFLIVPSTCYETFGRVIIEAFASGIPVVVSNIGALKELVVEGKNGVLFRSGDLEDLVEKLRTMFHNKDSLKAMGDYSRRIYEQKYTADKNYDQLMSIYQKAINK